MREAGRGEAPQRSRKEVEDRLDQLAEIVDIFEKTSDKGFNALSERADLRAELERMEATETRTAGSPTEEKNFEPVLPPDQKEALQQREDLNQVLAREMSGLIQHGMSRPEVKLALARMRDPKNVERFVDNQVGVEFFTQDIKRDLKARQVVEDALARLYESANGESYYQGEEAA